MNLLKSFIVRLNQPFPSSTSISISEKIKVPFFIGSFVSMFLYIFQPFGLAQYPGNKFLLCLGFGAVTFVVNIFIEFTGSFIFKLKKGYPSWTLKRWLIHAMVNVCFIALGNYLFLQYAMGWQTFHWRSLAIMLIDTFSIGIFPILFSGLIIQLKSSRSFQKEAQAIQLVRTQAPDQLTFPNSVQAIHHTSISAPNDPTITLTAHSSNDSMNLALHDILYIEAMQNYVAIFFIDPTHESSIQKKLLRNTIRTISDQLANTSIIRCHRSYLVHLIHVDDVSGNAQGLRLSLSHPKAPPIPVSRKYVPIIRKSLIS